MANSGSRASHEKHRPDMSMASSGVCLFDIAISPVLGLRSGRPSCPQRFRPHRRGGISLNSRLDISSNASLFGINLLALMATQIRVIPADLGRLGSYLTRSQMTC
jgi:hypothetical protein